MDKYCEILTLKYSEILTLKFNNVPIPLPISQFYCYLSYKKENTFDLKMYLCFSLNTLLFLLVKQKKSYKTDFR